MEVIYSNVTPNIMIDSKKGNIRIMNCSDNSLVREIPGSAKKDICLFDASDTRRMKARAIKWIKKTEKEKLKNIELFDLYGAQQTNLEDAAFVLIEIL